MGTERHTPKPYATEAKVTEFWRHVDATAGDDACWEWLGYKEKGYGRFYYRNRMRMAHDLALSFTTGEARLRNWDTCHSCDNPSCCNPAHLRFDVRQGNVRDMTSRGRQARGERNGQASLSDEDVVNIRRRRAAGAKQSNLAEEYGLTPSAVSMIVRGERWTHVGGPISSQHGNRKHGRYAQERTSS